MYYLYYLCFVLLALSRPSAISSFLWSPEIVPKTSHLPEHTDFNATQRPCFWPFGPISADNAGSLISLNKVTGLNLIFEFAWNKRVNLIRQSIFSPKIVQYAESSRTRNLPCVIDLINGQYIPESPLTLLSANYLFLCFIGIARKRVLWFVAFWSEATQIR